MKVAKNMDSVFANCTDDELEFDIYFDDDETIIDVLAGVDEAGNLITESFTEDDDDFDFVDEADDMVGENPDFEYQNDGDASGSEKDAEGTKEVKPELDGEIGDGKEVSGKENSAESQANDTKDEEEAIGMNDKQQTALESSDEGPLEHDDEALRDGEVSDDAVETESADMLLAMLEAEEPEVEGDPGDESDEEIKAETESTEVEVEEACAKEETEAPEGTEEKEIEVSPEVANDEKCCKEEVEVEESVEGPETEDEPVGEAVEEVNEDELYIESLLADLEEATKDPIADSECPNDGDKRAGCVKPDTSNIEGEGQEVLGKSIVGDVKCDPIADIDDSEAREGKDTGCGDTEGVKTHVVGAALEASDDFIDDLLNDLDEDEDDIAAIDAEEIVPDDVVTDGTDNSDIEVKEAGDIADATDDADIEAIDAEKMPKDVDDSGIETEVEYDYDDDELIDAVINGDVDDLED